jgi:hypothetical protein
LGSHALPGGFCLRQSGGVQRRISLPAETLDAVPFGLPVADEDHGG